MPEKKEKGREVKGREKCWSFCLVYVTWVLIPDFLSLGWLHCKYISAGNMPLYVLVRLSVHLWCSSNNKLLDRTAGKTSIYFTERHAGSYAVSSQENAHDYANGPNRLIPGQWLKSVVQKWYCFGIGMKNRFQDKNEYFQVSPGKNRCLFNLFVYLNLYWNFLK